MPIHRGGRIHAEALATALIVHLFRTYGEGRADFRVATGGMNGIRLRRVIEYIESHLNEDISLCALASVDALKLQHAPIADCARYDTLRRNF